MAGITVGTALAVSAAATVGTSLIAANAQKKAAQAQQSALNDVKPVDVIKVAADAKAADLDKYKNQFTLLNQVDPATGQLRDASNAGLAESIGTSVYDKNLDQSNALLGSLFGENVNVDPNDKAFYDQLKARAASELAQGGNFSPEQQAELVRAGLEQGGQGGFAPGSSATRQGVGKLLASESESLKNSRQAMAQQLFGFASSLKDNRNNTLLNISGAQQGAAAQAAAQRNADFSKLFSLANLADSRVPDIGLGGSDIANLAVANNNTANNVTLQKGAVQANRTAANGQIAAGLVGGLASLPGQYLTYQRLQPKVASTNLVVPNTTLKAPTISYK